MPSKNYKFIDPQFYACVEIFVNSCKILVTTLIPTFGTPDFPLYYSSLLNILEVNFVELQKKNQG